jgi:pilus assembly protein Flp/PilA
MVLGVYEAFTSKGQTRREAGAQSLGSLHLDRPGCRKENREMRRFTQFAVEFLRREDGPTTVEYAVMLALIIVVCIAALTTLGTNAEQTFDTVANAISSSS